MSHVHVAWLFMSLLVCGKKLLNVLLHNGDIITRFKCANTKKKIKYRKSVKSSHSDINLCQATVASKVPEQTPPPPSGLRGGKSGLNQPKTPVVFAPLRSAYAFTSLNQFAMMNRPHLAPQLVLCWVPPLCFSLRLEICLGWGMWPWAEGTIKGRGKKKNKVPTKEFEPRCSDLAKQEALRSASSLPGTGEKPPAGHWFWQLYIEKNKYARSHGRTRERV